jgi:hypothetical protein
MTMPDNMGRLPKIGGAVDLVICLDITGSMAPCIKGLRRNLGGFVEALESPYYNEGAQCVTKVTSWTMRLVPYRDFNFTKTYAPIIDDFPFVSDEEQVKAQIDDPRVKAVGGGGDGPESTLDAMFRAARDSEWRQQQATKRFVIVFTDATPLPLHEDTVGKDMPRDLAELLQLFKARQVIPVIFGPDSNEYRQITGIHPISTAVSRFFASTKEARGFFDEQGEIFDALFIELGKSISSSLGAEF